MKRFQILIALLVLTASGLAGCRRPDTRPTELPPTEGMTVMPTQEPTTVPTTVAPSTELPTYTDDATGTTESGATDATTGTVNARSRNTLPGMK